MRAMLRGRIVGGGLLIVMALISLFYSPTYSYQGTSTPTSFRRSVPTLQPLPVPQLGVAELSVTLYLEDQPVQATIDGAKAAGLSDAEAFVVGTIQWLRINAAQQQLIAVLTAPPFNATLREQSLRLQNSITIWLDAELISQVERLPGVVSIRIGGSPDLPPQPTSERPPRDQIVPGTRQPPLQPPGLD